MSSAVTPVFGEINEKRIVLEAFQWKSQTGQSGPPDKQRQTDAV